MLWFASKACLAAHPVLHGAAGPFAEPRRRCHPLERHSALAHQVPVCVPEPLDSLLVAGELFFSVSAFATRTLAVRAWQRQHK